MNNAKRGTQRPIRPPLSGVAAGIWASLGILTARPAQKSICLEIVFAAAHQQVLASLGGGVPATGVRVPAFRTAGAWLACSSTSIGLGPNQRWSRRSRSPMRARCRMTWQLLVAMPTPRQFQRCQKPRNSRIAEHAGGVLGQLCQTDFEPSKLMLGKGGFGLPQLSGMLVGRQKPLRSNRCSSKSASSAASAPSRQRRRCAGAGAGGRSCSWDGERRSSGAARPEKRLAADGWPALPPGSCLQRPGPFSAVPRARHVAAQTR